MTPRDRTVRNVATMSERERDEYYRVEAQAFVDENPDYYPVPQNQQKVFAALEANRYDLTRNNLTIIFQALQDQGELIPWPTDLPNGHTKSHTDSSAKTNLRRSLILPLLRPDHGAYRRDLEAQMLPPHHPRRPPRRGSHALTSSVCRDGSTKTG